MNLSVPICSNMVEDFWHVSEHIKFVHVHLEKGRVYSSLAQGVCSWSNYTDVVLLTINAVGI